MEDPPGTIARRARASPRFAGRRARSRSSMTWPLATGLGHLGRTDADRRRRPVQHLEHRLGRAHARRRSAAALRRQHLLPAQARRSPIRGQPAAGRSACRSTGCHGNPWLTLERRAAGRVQRRRSSARICCSRYLTGSRARRGRRRHRLRLLSVRDVAPVAHPAALHRRDSAVAADAAPAWRTTFLPPEGGSHEGVGSRESPLRRGFRL